MIDNARPKSQYGMCAAVVSGHHLASLQAQRCLAAGGSLVDAMVTASAVLAVVLPHASSLGGCGMLLYFDAASGKVHALNGTGRAPLATEPGAFADGMPQRGVRAAVVPTLVRLWARAHERFGRLPWAQLLAPAIGYAAQGCAVPEELARNLQQADARLRSQPGFADLLLPNGQPLRAGRPLLQPALAEVLRHIAAQGEQGFYAGPATDSLVAFSRAHGGLFAAEDFARAQADWSDAWQTPLGAASVHVMPPNSVGVLMLQQLARWQEAGRPLDTADTVASVETAIACIAAGRGRIGDADRHPTCPADFGLPAALPFGEALAGFQASRAGAGDTTGFVAMDADGNALALLQSVFQPFGSGAVDPGTGILLNNRMFDFATEAGRADSVAPAARPSHTLNPWLVLQGGRAVLAGVSPGGVSQTTTGYQIVRGALGGEHTLGQLVEQPRWSLSRDGAVLLEPGMPSAVAEALRARGHAVEQDSHHAFYFGSVKLLRRSHEGVIEAAADPRRQAAALAW